MIIDYYTTLPLPLQIHLFLPNFATFVRIKAMSVDVESSHCALSIGCSCKVKYRCFVDRLTSRVV